MNGRMINNLFSVYGYIVYLLLFLISPQDIHSWDLAVANDGGINFFDTDGKIESSPVEIQQLNDLYVLAYDSFLRRIFFSVTEHNTTSIFSYNLSDNALTQLVPRQSHDVQGIAHDATTQTLFWTDGYGRTIWKRSLINDSSPPEVLLHLEKQIPAGIAVSFCKRLLFWANSNHLSGSIDRSNLDGSNHVELITSDIYQPLAITVDEPYGKLYWTDSRKGIYYRIERSNLDGSDRELVIHRTNQEPFGIAASNRAIYWTDTIQKSVWMLSSDMLFPNHTMAKLEPEIFHKFKQFTPFGIAAFSDGIYDCDLVRKVPVPKLTFANEEDVSAKEDSWSSCFNSGYYIGNSCKCKNGYTGKWCETSVCHNYCLNGGQCYLDDAGYAECRCQAGFKGSRCEVDVCNGFCLNGGRCSINNSVPLCSCGLRFLGQRCETSMDFVCDQICSNSIASTLCDCNSTKWRYEASTDYIQSLDASHCQQQHIITISLICFGVMAMLVIVALTRKVCILRRRPRIKKRIIVNKGVKSQTPMTARPPVVGSGEQCEITIENCCNMNICETPCFEPNLRSSRSPSSQHSKKTEDRKNLLKNMEEEFGGSDGCYS